VGGLLLAGCGGGASTTAPTSAITNPPAPTRNAILNISCGCFETYEGDPKTVRFSPTLLGFSGSQVLTFSNSGTDTLTVTNIVPVGLEGDGSKAFSASPTAFALPPGQLRTVTVVFRPVNALPAGVSYLAADSARLTVTSDQTGGDTSVVLLGCHRYDTTQGC
jgi:hypothetical protein